MRPRHTYIPRLKGVGLQDKRCRFTGGRKESRENPMLSAFREGKNRLFQSKGVGLQEERCKLY